MISNDEQFMQDLVFTKSIFGGTMSPFNAYNILKGVSTLTIRMKQHSENAQRVATFLDGHPAVLETRYPGLPSDPNHETAKRLFGASGYSGMVKLCHLRRSTGSGGICRFPQGGQAVDFTGRSLLAAIPAGPRRAKPPTHGLCRWAGRPCCVRSAADAGRPSEPGPA